MTFKFRLGIPVVAACFVAMSAMALDAKPLSEAGGPAEVPPASFKGKQYVDSRGCVFVRAGVGKSVTWVPRVTRDRQAVCGFAPSLGRQVAASTPKPKRVVRPTPVQSIVVAPAPTPVAKPRNTAVVAAPRAVAAPQPRVVVSRPTPKPRVVAKPKPVVETVAAVPIVIPEGYKPAWSDGRLNPNRAQGTAVGEAQMASIWTNTVPRKAIVPAVRTTAAAPAAGILGTKTAPVAPVAPIAKPSGHRFVQIASFSVPSNAQATARKLQAAGLPVQLRKTTYKGRAIQIVLAGPFASKAGLDQGLATARKSGFSDAFTR